MTEAAAAAAANGSQSATAPAAAGAGGSSAAQATAPASGTITGNAGSAGQPAAAPATDAYAAIKAPEGFDSAGMPKMIEVAREWGLTADKAQKLIDQTHASQVKAKADADAAAAQGRAANLEALKADKDFGGEKFAANMQRMQQAVDKIEARIPGVKALLDRIPDHDPGYPVAVRLFAFLGEQGREDTFAAAGGQSAGEQPKTLAALMYPPPKT